MAKTLDDILQLQSIDLNDFEIRGAKPGINNSYATGTVYTKDPYVPQSSVLTGTGTIDSSNITAFAFDAPYGSLNALTLRHNDVIGINSSYYLVNTVLNATSLELTEDTGLSGSYGLDMTLINREYLVEPDVFNNTVTDGVAYYQNANTTVLGVGTNWLSELSPGDIIKHDAYQVYYSIQSVITNTQLSLTIAYAGDTTSGTYTAKKVDIGSTQIQYIKDDFEYNKENAHWEYDATTGSAIDTHLYFSNLADGIKLKFSKASDSDFPDLMDVNTAENNILSQSTQYDSFQFSLPVIPYPENTLIVYINNIKKDRFPDEGHDYVVSYSQDPVYTPPPPVQDRRVANLMFLDRIEDITPATSVTEYGYFQLVDSDGELLNSIMPGSEEVSIDSTAQTLYEDYVLQPSSGTLILTDSTLNEPLTKYIGESLNKYIDYGFSVYLNGKKQKISFPAQPDDDVIFQPLTGRLKPSTQDYPGPSDTYQVYYEVEANRISDEQITASQDQTSFGTAYLPVKRGSVFLSKNGIVLDEDTEFHFSYRTGTIILNDPADGGDVLSVGYTPLSLQANDLTRVDSTSYCTVHDSRLTVTSASTFEFTLINDALEDTDITIYRVYNETKEKEYDIASIQKNGLVIVLASNTNNTSIGLESSDIVVIDYRYENELLEYKPVIISTYDLALDTSSIYIENINISSLISVGSTLRIGTSDSATAYFFDVISVEYTGIDTKIDLKTILPVSFINPTLSISESITYNTVPAYADEAISGSIYLSFSDAKIPNIFRANTLLKINNDIYSVAQATYEQDQTATVVALSSSIMRDYTSGTTVAYSDCPVYTEGDLELFPRQKVVTLIDQPGLMFSTTINDIYFLNSDSTALYVNSDPFLFSSNPTLGDLSSSISLSYTDIDITCYINGWNSNKIIPFDSTMHQDSPALVSVGPALRLDGTDNNNFSVTDGGSVLLESGLVKGQNYTLDYMGEQYLGDSSVTYSVDYFVVLPEASKVSISLQYLNLDQFYIQVLSQRDFLSNVTIPRIDEEAAILSGNVSQGGTIPNDNDAGNNEGGLINDEYRRKDAEIECSIFNNIFDFFNDRVSAFSQELYAATGQRLFNNDGTFSETEQSVATKSINRIFPDPDYTNLNPYWANPLTGEFTASGAFFTNGSTNVTGSSLWTLQLPSDGTNYIGLADSTKRYKVSTVVSDTQLTLATNFIENSTINPDGDTYKASTNFPIYDDDGHLGAKIIGYREKNFGLSDGNVFDVYVDGTYRDYTFEEPLDPFMALLYPVNKLTAEDVSRLLTASITGITCTSERVLDPSNTYGYRNTLVLRTDPPDYNCMVLGSGAAVNKLGFIPGYSACGNLDRTGSSPELILNIKEREYLADEVTRVSNLLATVFDDKLDRTNPTGILDTNTIYSDVAQEKSLILSEQDKLDDEISALSILSAEPNQTPYSDTSATASVALAAAIAQKGYNTVAYSIDSALNPGWQGKGVNWKWSLDFTERDQYVRGKDGAGIGVATGGTSINGETSFILECPTGDDIRIMNSTIFGTLYTPIIVYENDSQPVDGVWTGWDVGVSNKYSTNRQITFTFNSAVDLFSIYPGVGVTVPIYSIDRTALNLNWDYLSVPQSAVLRYADYSLISNMKTAINGLSGLSAVGSAVHDSSYSESFLLTSSTSFSPDATIYPALRSTYIEYQTIADDLLNDRNTYITYRDGTLSARDTFLSTREIQIKYDLGNEELLRDSDGTTGDLYNWADVRFNRRQGCEAKLKQMEALIMSNQSALTTNQIVSG